VCGEGLEAFCLEDLGLLGGVLPGSRVVEVMGCVGEGGCTSLLPKSPCMLAI
jgi:hypothetical protein